jgi:hypothetical protein
MFHHNAAQRTAPLLLLANYPNHPYLYNKHTFIEQLTLLILLQTDDPESTHKSLPIITALYPRILESVFNNNFWEKLQQTYISTYYSTQSWQKNHFTFGFDGTYPRHELQYTCSINVLCFLPLSECEMLYLDLFHLLLCPHVDIYMIQL